MNHRILFIVYNNELKFLDNTTMDHKEWYQSLGGNMDEYDNVIRGYIMDGMIIFFKSNLNYDNEVISFAQKMGLKMKEQLKQPDLKVCCGINPGQNGEKWEPILILKDTDLEGYKTEEQIEKEKQEELKKEQLQALKDTSTEPIVEFKNNIEDSIFRKSAILFTLIFLILAIISKIIMIHNKTMMLSNRWNALLLFIQIGSFIVTLLAYITKNKKAKISAVIASVASIVIFAFLDIVIGVLNLLFTMDHTFFTKGMDYIKKWFQTIISKKKV